MPERYDVIIIGTGAGGGTLAHTLAPSGKKILLLERGDFLPRETENWDPGAGLHRRPVHLAGHLVRRRRHARSSRRCTTSSAARRRCTAPRCTACARRTSASSSTSTASRRRGRSPTTTSSRTTRRPSGSTRCTATTARTRPRGTGASSTRGPRCRTSRGSSNCPTTWRPAATTRSTRRAASCSTRPTGRGARASAAPGATATRASSTRSPTPRRSPCALCSSMPNVTLLVDAEVVQLETDARGRTVTGVVVDRDGERRDLRRRHRGRRRPARRTARKILLRSANDQHPNGLANGSDQVGRNYMFHNSKAVVALSKEPNDTVFQKTLGLNDFYFGADDYDWPVGQIQMVGKSNAEAMKGEEPKLTKLAPHWSPRGGRAARGRLLAHDRGPPDARQPGHPRRRRQRAPRVHVDQRRGGRPPLPRAQEDAEPRRHGRAPRAATRTSTCT